ncbi:hypothetical protein HZA56_03050 [Candidatus Poribacteria bacterium]|nr:hypothetical protein [Candidatus Poribacteria bacterium]
MSEYQYYEFQAVDHRLTQKQMDELRDYSSRAEITPTSFVNVYNWGSFKGNVDKWMEKYFDAFLYVANWGTRRLIFRIPKRLLNPDTVAGYHADETLWSRMDGDHLVLSFDSNEEEPGWEEGEGWLDSLIPLRSDLMNGDHRCLYLGWLSAVHRGMLADDDLDPPVPPGLSSLSEPLESLAKFLRIDPDLIATVSEKSGEKLPHGPSKDDLATWVANLPSKDKDSFLMRLLDGDDPHVAAEFRQRALFEIRGAADSASGLQSGGRRSVGELVARAEVISKERKKREAEKKAKEEARLEKIRTENHKRHVESLFGKEAALWTEVDNLIATKQQKRYDEAVSILIDLRDLARMQGKTTEFANRMNALHCEHDRKPSLRNRLHKANL